MSAVALLARGTPFPHPEDADDARGGLLAVGGDLGCARLLDAYARGIFPWFESPPVLWWSPDPRAVIRPGDLEVTRSLAKRVRNSGLRVSFDEAFGEVIRACAAPRRSGPGTWITPGMQRAYTALHELGYAHSVETWQGDRLVGGLYGVSLGRVFFGESMFSRVSDASKIAFHHLCRRLEAWSFELIDCQLPNEHLMSLGVTEMRRRDFLAILAENQREASRIGRWCSTDEAGASHAG